ncbi:serine hydrolase domain-containing protein [Haliea sp. E1-2-M8]|uniref:serine hydrolase domain-containing protein n=1 Tax=Haliea sp. E1-2-M8 TaxID=3064706 RepID=UPI0027183A04|nr:serine hydrolase domain-containing protein [Haliea sp. E1-2-M8]MDO8863203.1 serine hydrolase domain-containing protein [Haliea sp. E1-2-M8]
MAIEIPWQGLTPAYTILVDVGGETFYSNSVGFADLEHQVAAGSDTVYQLGSITKSYTAHLVLQLVAGGELQLEGRVVDYLPDYEGPGRHANLQQLLTHTSGIANYTALPTGQAILTWVPNQREDILRLFADTPLDFESGSHFLYSNSGYYLLGLILEAVTGEDFYALLQERILDPLGLTHTYSGRHEDIVANRAQGYLATPEGFHNAAPTPYLTPFAAGSIQATAADLAQYRRKIFTSSAVAESLRTLITRTLAFPDGTPQTYALGALTRNENHGYTVWAHGGSITGFSSHHAYYPELDMTVVILSNAGNPPVSPAVLSRKITSLLLGKEPVIPEPLVRQPGPERLRQLSGTYLMTPFRLTADGLFSLVYHDGTLLARLGAADDEQAPTLPLTAVGPGEFVAQGGMGLQVRLREVDGVVTGVDISIPAMDRPPFPAIPTSGR